MPSVFGASQRFQNPSCPGCSVWGPVAADAVAGGIFGATCSLASCPGCAGLSSQIGVHYLALWGCQDRGTVLGWRGGRGWELSWLHLHLGRHQRCLHRRFVERWLQVRPWRRWSRRAHGVSPLGAAAWAGSPPLVSSVSPVTAVGSGLAALIKECYLGFLKGFLEGFLKGFLKGFLNGI